MTNSEMLRRKIKESGLKISAICEKVGISSGPLKKKIDGDVEFRASEISALSAILGLTGDERTAIFFANEVE